MLHSRRGSLFVLNSLEVFLQDASHFEDRFWRAMNILVLRDYLNFGFSIVRMGAFKRNDSIASLRQPVEYALLRDDSHDIVISHPRGPRRSQ